MLRRLHHEQPETFAFTPDNRAWAEAQITKFPEGRQASAIIPLLWRAQEQEGWLSRPAIESIADMLGMPYIRALEVATFYFMFQLQPTGSVAHVQVCGTTSCMIMGAEGLMSVCQRKIAERAHEVSADGKFSWEEVECLGACTNAPMVQIGKDYYEDLTEERFEEILDELAAGKVPVPGPQNGRYSSEPKSGLTSLGEYDSGKTQYNASAQLAVDIGETVKRIDGTEVPLSAPWTDAGARPATPPGNGATEPRPAKGMPADETGVTEQEAPEETVAKPRADAAQDAETSGAGLKPSAPLEGQAELASRRGQWKYESPVSSDDPASATDPAPADAPDAEPTDEDKPEALSAARDGAPDDLKQIKGVGPKLEAMLNDMGFYHFDQVASWTEREVAWVDANLTGFKGRVSRDDWVAQAQQLAADKDSDDAS